MKTMRHTGNAADFPGAGNPKHAGSPDAPDLPLVFYYHRLNTYSFNALAGAMDREADFHGLPIALPTTGERLRAVLSGLMQRRDRGILGLSVMTCQFGEIQELVRWVRGEYGSRIVILAGGPHPTACPRETLEAGVDFVFTGEAETSFPALLRKLAQGEEPADIPGVASLNNGSMIARPQSRPADLDVLFSFSPRRGMFGPIEITRGCPFACRYCQTSRIFGVSLRHRSIDSIVRQAAALRSGSRRVVRLLSPNAFSYGSKDGRALNMEAMRGLLSALRETVSENGRIIFAHFPSEARPEHVTPDTLDLLKEFADNDEIVIGAQSGSRRMLEACNRSHDVESVLTAVSLARRYGYKIIVDFIVGLPGENPADQRESLKVMEEVVRMGARIHAHLFSPLPQTPFADSRPGCVDPDVLRVLERLKARRGIYENHRDTVRV
jgi:B12-binding domain/radical SAM domain protein